MTLWYWNADEAAPECCLGGALTIGNFDAVHRGHQWLIRCTRTMARRVSGPAVALSFDPPPHQVLHPGSYRPPLTTLEDRAHWLQQAGADHLLVLRTTPELLAYEAEDFFDRLLIGHLRIRGLVEGQDFRFGWQRRGDVELLRRLCARVQCCLEVLSPLLHGGIPISSSRVRQALEQGQVELARELLGRAYEVAGRVVAGSRRGQTLGFPTANLAEVKTLLPADGVYAVRVRQEATVQEGALLGVWPGAAHIGPNPTFGEQMRKIEVHLLDFTGNLYGQRLRLEFLRRVRETRRFASATELVEQLRHDLEMVRSCWQLENQRKSEIEDDVL